MVFKVNKYNIWSMQSTRYWILCNNYIYIFQQISFKMRAIVGVLLLLLVVAAQSSFVFEFECPKERLCRYHEGDALKEKVFCLNSTKPYISDDLRSIRHLALRCENLQKLPDGIFDNLGNLYKLDLRGNNFSSLPDKLLHKNNRLSYFYLSHVHSKNNGGYYYQNLVTLPNNLFYFNKIWEVDLSVNGLKYLPEDLFSGVIAGQTLSINLRANFLTTLPETIFKPFFDILTID